MDLRANGLTDLWANGLTDLTANGWTDLRPKANEQLYAELLQQPFVLRYRSTKRVVKAFTSDCDLAAHR